MLQDAAGTEAELVALDEDCQNLGLARTDHSYSGCVSNKLLGGAGKAFGHDGDTWQRLPVGVADDERERTGCAGVVTRQILACGLEDDIWWRSWQSESTRFPFPSSTSGAVASSTPEFS